MGKKNSGNDVSVFITVRVNPASGRFRFYEKDGRFFVDVKNRPDKGMVNREIVVNLGKLLGREVEIAGGHKSREKLVLVKGASLEEVRKVLSDGR